jgi:hypothetical protein
MLPPLLNQLQATKKPSAQKFACKNLQAKIRTAGAATSSNWWPSIIEGVDFHLSEVISARGGLPRQAD